MDEQQEKKGVGDIEISNTRKTFFDKQKDFSYNDEVSYKTKNKRNFIKILLILVLFIAIFISVSMIFHKANIEISSKGKSHTFSNDFFVAVADIKEVDGQQKEEVQDVKSIVVGDIKIINNTSKDVKLVKRTRFQVDDLVFRIQKSVTIPAKKNIIAQGVAEKEGGDYKITKDTKLEIPGFKESNLMDKYENVYGLANIDFDFGKNSDEKIEPETTEKAEDGDDKVGNLPEIKYNTFSVISTAEKRISSIGIDEIEKKADGKIKIVNNTSKTQKIVKNTRFKKDDLIFKIKTSTTILPKSSTIVNATADIAGTDYNIKKETKLEIPGFEEAKLMDHFKNIYGLVETDFTGGNIGKENIPDKNELEKTENELKKQLAEDLDTKVRKFVLNKYLLIKGGEKTIYNMKTISVDDDVLVVVEATRKGQIINKDDFIKQALLSDEVTLDDLKDLEIVGIHKLDVKILDSESFDPESGESFKFSVSGKIQRVNRVDTQLFKEVISGKTRDEYIKQVENSFPELKVRVLVSPFWRNSIPKNLEKINIEIVENENKN